MGGKEKSYHIYFVKAHKRGKLKGIKTDVWIVRKDSHRAKSERLGLIKWRGAWWQYVFYPDEKTLWSDACLYQIAEFLTGINDKQRRKWRK